MIFSLILFMSMAQAAGKRAPVSVPDPVVSTLPSPAASASPSPTPAPTDSGQRIIVGKIFGATAAEEKMIRDGEKLANAMLDKYCFKQWVLAARYTENNGLSQKQIFDLVISQPSKVDVEMYTGSWKANYVSKTVGYENDPFDGVVHMNRHFVNTAYMVGDNLIHEDRGHSLGFHHYNVFSTSEPYGQNYAYEGCSHAQEMQAKGGKRYRPPGIRIEVRHVKKSAKKGAA